MKLTPEAKIYVAGHQGMVGSSLLRKFKAMGLENVITRTQGELDLCDASLVNEFFQDEKPDYVILAAARVGGIHANNTYPAEFIQQNLSISSNCIHSAWQAGVARFLFLGSSCIYPRMAPQPICEDALLTSELEPTNEAYALAKIAGLKMCYYYRKQYDCLFHSVMPTNLYGKGDNYHPENSHVLPAFIRRIHEAKESSSPEVVIWGSGKPRREFLHVDDLAAAIVHLIQLDNPPDWVNVGTGVDSTILELAELVRDVIGYKGKFVFDPSKPDGTPRKLLNISKIEDTGWKPEIDLKSGIEKTYQDFMNEYNLVEK